MSKKEITKKDIDKEIKNLEALKKKFPARDIFGGDNHGPIDAQIRVLKEDMDEAEIEREWYTDETAEEFSDGDNDIYHAAIRAREWVDGNEDPPSK